MPFDPTPLPHAPCAICAATLHAEARYPQKVCRGNLDRMVTVTRMLLIEGLKLAEKTFAAARQALGWVVEELDQFVIHQVSQVHTQAFIKAFGIDPQ